MIGIEEMTGKKVVTISHQEECGNSNDKIRDKEKIRDKKEIKNRKETRDKKEIKDNETILSRAKCHNSNIEDIDEITILPGYDKDNELEKSGALTLKMGEMCTIVGDTGSGKSQYIKDIEQLVFGDSITKRKVLLNGESVPSSKRSDLSSRLIAHLGQSMRFVLDISVEEFIVLHSQYRNCNHGEGDSKKRSCEHEIEKKETERKETERQEIERKETEKQETEEKETKKAKYIIDKVVNMANSITPEPIFPHQSLNTLSGGQSRALMIADIAFVCDSPIVLIDEIENAGIDKVRALEMLTNRKKLVLIVTHDLQTALMASKRIVIQNGGVEAIIERNEEEETVYKDLETAYKKQLAQQGLMRRGDRIKQKPRKEDNQNEKSEIILE
jgi:ABC-type lipoprotein export system ATPase subunit